MRCYIALIHKTADSDFGVSFPDLPGCVTAGETLDEARVFAEEALVLHLARLAQDGDPAPEPSSLEAIMRQRENQDGVAVLIPTKSSSRVVRVNITLPEDVLERIDAYAEKHGMNRSGFLARAAQREIETA